MAASGSVRLLEDQVSCYICRDYYTEPVSVDCGHSFCQGCITQHWEKWGSDFSCPRCGEASLKRKLRPNKELANIVETVKRTKLEMAENTPGEKKTCETHQQPLQFFCKGKQELVCSRCVESEEVPSEALLLPLEEAAQSYKEELDSLLKAWKEKREEAIGFHTEEENRYKKLQEKVNTEKQKIVSIFEEAEVHLKQEKAALLDQLEELVEREEVFVTKLSGDICLRDTLIQEMEEKNRQPPSTFLQDIEKTLQRYKVWHIQQPSIFSELEDKVNSFSKKYIILQETLRSFKEYLPQQLQVEWVKVTLDPDTAHPQLTVSDDRKTLTLEWNSCNLPDYPQRFSSSCCVLGCEGFTSGRHYWEVKVESGFWAVGVARESVNRKKQINISSLQEGIWILSKYKIGKLTYDTPETIGIYLDYEKRKVLFFNADNNKGNVLHTFDSALFKAEKIRPIFWLKRERYSSVQKTV
uniref:Tripartite motif-containing protein 10-like isoform X2 n=1 Tax=Pogona vitticeps TaxID=103695 RepID=A0ABM5FIX5_9SAUR